MYKTIYFDMDGVLADFEGKRNAVKRFDKERGFFLKLKPIKTSVKAVKKLIDIGVDVRVLSASPNPQADYDKRKWLEKYIPELEHSKIIICRVGENKAYYVSDIKNALLVDDYTHNLLQFKEYGGNVLKFVNKRDNEKGKHTINKIQYTKNLINLEWF